MTIAKIFQFSQWFFTFYFIAMHLGYLILNILAIISIRKYMEEHSVNNLPQIYTGLELPISLLVPAFNEELT
ncbi:MAG: glycosyltransferase family 2 protein, partial [Gammaproteobacteria bacterium]|nr:glycosyltransferase family 2 protein [Gammaproteobacteria bacterium]